jgi:tRNA U34 5-methylaminomethyl-2-thiouridine-forming methyltransferase MnmC
MKPELLLTDDGSHTLFLPGINEGYHSRFGALQESLHIFIENGLLCLPEKLPEIRILEVGFGTGLNALLTLRHSIIQQQPIRYTAIEPFPVDECLLIQLNYPSLPGLEAVKDHFIPLHRATESNPTLITAGFIFEKIVSKIENAALSRTQYDLVYFDAFAPAVQPELWSEEVFAKIAGSMHMGGLLVTYSCKGTVKRALIAAGFSIEKVPGPLGKREFLRATKK